MSCQREMDVLQTSFVQAGARILVSADGIAVPHVCV